MSRQVRTIALGLVALTASVAADAQPAPPAGPPQPAAVAYSSAFEGYRPFAAEELGDWRKANDTVREVGGWRAYAREIHGGTRSPAPPSAAAPAPVAPAPRPPADPHGGHQR